MPRHSRRALRGCKPTVSALGGLFGDTVMGALLTILPIGSTFTVKLMSFLMGISILALGAFVLGFTQVELTRICRFLVVGVIVAYAGVMSLLGRSATGAVLAAQNLQARAIERRERRRVAAEEAAAFAATQQDFEAEDMQSVPVLAPQIEPKTGLLARMPA